MLPIDAFVIDILRIVPEHGDPATNARSRSTGTFISATGAARGGAAAHPRKALADGSAKASDDAEPPRPDSQTEAVHHGCAGGGTAALGGAGGRLDG